MPKGITDCSDCTAAGLEQLLADAADVLNGYYDTGYGQELTETEMVAQRTKALADILGARHWLRALATQMPRWTPNGDAGEPD